MDTCRRLSQIARVSNWKLKHTYPLFSASDIKGRIGCDSAPVIFRENENPYPLTKEEAFRFLDETLNIPHSEVYAGGTTLEFLNHVIRRIKETQPFTSMNLLGIEIQDFTPENMKFHVMSGQGGTCLWINPFTEALLEWLNFTVYHVSGKYPEDDDDNVKHISTIVCNLSYPGSRHLVDPGVRWPLYEAVPLDFTSESPEYTFHKMRTKFFKRDNEKLLLCIPSSRTTPEIEVIRDSEGGTWQTKMTFLLYDKIPWDKLLRRLESRAKYIKTWEKPFDSLLFFALLNKKQVSIVCSNGQTYATFYDLEDHTTKKILMTKMELMDFFLKNYPQYSVKKLEKVFKASQLT